MMIVKDPMRPGALAPWCGIPVSCRACCKTVGQWAPVAPVGRELSPSIDKSQRPKKATGSELLRPSIRGPANSLRAVGTRPPSRIAVTAKLSNSPSEKMAEVNQDEDVRSQKRDRSEFEGEGKFSSPTFHARLPRPQVG